MNWNYTWTDDAGKCGGTVSRARHDQYRRSFSTYINDVTIDHWVKAVDTSADGTWCSTTFYSSLTSDCTGSACTPPTPIKPNPPSSDSKRPRPASVAKRWQLRATLH